MYDNVHIRTTYRSNKINIQYVLIFALWRDKTWKRERERASRRYLLLLLQHTAHCFNNNAIHCFFFCSVISGSSVQKILHTLTQFNFSLSLSLPLHFVFSTFADHHGKVDIPLLILCFRTMCEHVVRTVTHSGAYSFQYILVMYHFTPKQRIYRIKNGYFRCLLIYSRVLFLSKQFYELAALEIISKSRFLSNELTKFSNWNWKSVADSRLMCAHATMHKLEMADLRHVSVKCHCAAVAPISHALAPIIFILILRGEMVHISNKMMKEK